MEEEKEEFSMWFTVLTIIVGFVLFWLLFK
jgi:hypothetical protein